MSMSKGIKEFQKGHPQSNTGRTHFKKGNKTKNQFKKGHKGYKSWLGKKLSEEHRKKLRENHADFKGKNNPAWRGGTSYEPYSTDWTATLRESIRQRDNYTCQLCGRTQEEELERYERKLPIHHTTYDKKDCNPNHLITLCLNCNGKVNKNRQYWKKYFLSLEKL